MMSSLSAIADTYYGPKDYSIVPPLPCAASERQYGAEGEGVSQTMWTYRYDGFGRLAEASATDAVSAPDRALGEVFEYDRNSNILSLERVYAGEPVQDAAMSYVGNRLTGVNDASMPYNKDIVPSFAAGTYALEYDGDGRLVADGTRGITDIKYTTDGMGLPTRIDLSADNKVYSSYLPDGTLIARDFRSVRTRTTVRVNSKGDTIVRTIREPVIDRTLYRGDWEISGYLGSGGWRINTPEGIASIVRNGADAAGRTFTHLWYVRDRLGSVRTVVDENGTIRQCTMFYPSGLPVQLFGTERVTDRAHIGNRWSNFAGLGWHDNIARWHDAILDRFTTPDPKAADYLSFSPYTHCAANPLRFTDPTGMHIYVVNDYGEIVNFIDDKEKDEIVMNNGENKLVLPFGAVHSQYDDDELLRTNKSLFESNSWDIGKSVFEFLSDNSEIEYSFIGAITDTGGTLSLITTSNDRKREENGILVIEQMDKAEKVAFYIHNHPSNTPYPSGLDTGGGDIRAAKDFSNILGYSIRNEIYVSILKAYIPYSTFSNICGFPQYIK